MERVFEFLQDPNLVAKFQHTFGIRIDPYGLHDDQALQDDQLTKKSVTIAQSKSTAPQTRAQTRQRTSQSMNNNSSKSRSSIPANPGKQLSSQQAHRIRDTTINSDSEPQKLPYTIKQKFFFFLFAFGASLGYEAFYATFFPLWFWNVDSFVGRRLIIVWVGVMYIGQAIKDIIKIPRPSSPPVVVLEPEYAMEYGMPSTHAMTGVALPFSMLIFTHNRYDYDLWIGILFATTWCLLICTSRLYNGMHSYLDILAGIIFAAGLMVVLVPLADAIDTIHTKSPYSPFFTIPLIIAMARFYPKPERWSPARGDTCVIMGAGSGILLGCWFCYQIGWIKEAIATNSSPPFPIMWPDQSTIAGLTLLRSVLGICCVVAARAVGRSLSYYLLCLIHQQDPKDPQTQRISFVELPHKLITYMVMGFSITWLGPLVFRLMGIERATMFTEI